MRGLAVTTLLVALAACQEAKLPPEPLCALALPVVSPDVWTIVPAEEDPFRREPSLDAGTTTTATTTLHRGRCGPLDCYAATLGGAPSYGITTLGCSWGTVETPAKLDVAEGGVLDIRIWHFSHIRVGPAEARVLLAVGDRPFWETRVPLPIEGGLIAETIAAPFAIARGDTVRWHVSNHGGNSWDFLDLSTPGEGPCPTDR